MNNVVLVGRLTRDVELRTTASGTSTASFSIAVERNFRNQQGEREADFINCVAWRGTAETLARYTHKGARIAVQGRIQTRNYENQQGQRVYVTEVVVENFDLIETRAESESYRQQHGYGGNQQGYTPNQGQANYGGQNPYGNPAGSNNMGNGSFNGFAGQGQGGFAGNNGGGFNSTSETPVAPSQTQASDANQDFNESPFKDDGEQVDLADDDLPF